MLLRSHARIGLALGGGAAKGIAHIGVIKALQEAGIPINVIAGTSIGALVGACYAKDAQISFLEEVALTSNMRKLSRLLDPKFILLGSSFFRARKVEGFLKSITGDKEFNELKIPFSAVATDINTGEEIILDKGSIIKAVRASISIPAVFTPINYNGRYLVDGGLTNPVPADVVRAMGANFIIAVNVLNDPKKRRHRGLTNDKNLGKPPTLINTMIQSIYIMQYEIIRGSILKADIIIEPDVSGIEAYEFYRGTEAIEVGYSAAKAVVPEIINLLNSY